LHQARTREILLQRGWMFQDGTRDLCLKLHLFSLLRSLFSKKRIRILSWKRNRDPEIRCNFRNKLRVPFKNIRRWRKSLILIWEMSRSIKSLFLLIVTCHIRCKILFSAMIDAFHCQPSICFQRFFLSESTIGRIVMTFCALSCSSSSESMRFRTASRKGHFLDWCPNPW
jgi:hypothetical protein